MEEASPQEAMQRMNDETETIRRQQLAEINAQPGSREALEAEHGQVWDTQQLGQDFTVRASWLPTSSSGGKSTGSGGASCSNTSPRLYFGFEPHRE